jgi:DNA-binding MarR family transcriptional regulator
MYAGGHLRRPKAVQHAASVQSDAPQLLTLALGPLDFEHNPGFLVSRIGRRMAAEMDRRMRDHGLTAAQAAVMSRLWMQDGLTQSQLQDQVGVDASTLTGLLQRMTRQGLVRRRRDASDGRVLRVLLTPHGRELRPQLTPEAESINSLFFRNFSSGERAIFIEFLHRALRNLETGEIQTERESDPA